MNDDNEYIRDENVGDTPAPALNDAEEAELDALLARFGADYNRPPDIVPREEMWHQIRIESEQRRSIRKRPMWAALAAAVVLLGVGIGIGAEVHSRIGQQASPLSSNTSSIAVATPQSHDQSIDTSNATVRQGVEPSGSQPRIVANRGTYASANGVDAMHSGARSQAYTLATVRHFTAVEALLTSYETAPHDARGDAEMASWARALLSQTRLLLDSPAASDPARRNLLQDLELVLVQMTQLSPADTPIDREMIDGSVRHSDVITRLRTAVPAGGATHL
jgi:hypothetical protein